MTIISDNFGENRKHLVMACDSCGGIGEKQGDTLNSPPYYVGRLTARVALTEVLCSGARPVALGNGVCSEMNPTGGQIIRGVLDELAAAGLSGIGFNGSTEENFNTAMTATGITVVGTASELRFDRAMPGDKLVLLGRPAIGADVDLAGGGFYGEIIRLLAVPGVRELVPVGSKGIAHEAEILAELNALSFSAYAAGIDLKKSAGPATCIAVLCDSESAGVINGTVVGEYRNLL